jgi:hypothetical protein
MNTNHTKLCALILLLAIVAAAPGRLPGQGCSGGDPCQPCPPVTCKVLLPQVTTEYQTRWITRYRPEVRQRMVAVYRDVPSTRTVEEKYTVMVPQTQMRTVVDTINRPIYGDIQLRTTAMTPQVDPQQGIYTVSQMIPVHEERTARDSDDMPTGWTAVSPPPVPGGVDPNAPPLPASIAASPAEGAVAGSACTTCNACSHKVCATTWKPVSQQVKVQYALTHFQPNVRMDTVSYYEFQAETKTHEEPYVVDVPEERTRTRTVSITRTVEEQQPEKYTVLVPYQESIRYPVRVCRYVEQTVIVR